LLATATACFSSRPGKVHRFGGCSPIVQGREILCDGAVVASVECHGRSDDACRGLAMRYYDGNVAWLYQAPWFDPERPETALDRDTQYDWASNVEITPDARYLWYRTVEENRTRWLEYDVQAGMQQPIDRFRIVELRDTYYRGTTVRIPLFDPANDKPDSG
jgi:hypothetical protein